MKLFFIDMIEMALPISILISLLLIISPLIKKSFVVKWRYFMWMFIALRLIIPFKLNAFTAPITMRIPNSLYAASSDSFQSIDQSSLISPQNIIMMIWIMGMICFGLYQALSYLSFSRAVRRWSKTVNDDMMIRFFREIKKSTGKKRKLDIKICRAISTPMLFGLIKPTLLMPDRSYTEQELNVILSHELIHFKRNDILYKFLITVANCINWFNPFVYIMANAANRDIELVCDSEVVKNHDMKFRCDYCSVILNMIHNRKTYTTPLSTCFIISKKVMKERFSQILDIKKKRKGIIMFIIVMVSAAISGSLITFAAERVADTVENELISSEGYSTPITSEANIPTSDQSNSAPVYTEQETEYPDVKSTTIKSDSIINKYSDTETADDEIYYDTEQNQTASYNISSIQNDDIYNTYSISSVDSYASNTAQSDAETQKTSIKGEETDYIPNVEPDSISSDGSKETYNISDDKTVVLQYGDDNELDTGYIIIK